MKGPGILPILKNLLNNNSIYDEKIQKDILSLVPSLVLIIRKIIFEKDSFIKLQNLISKSNLLNEIKKMEGTILSGILFINFFFFK